MPAVDSDGMEWENLSPGLDHDACGVGFVATLNRQPTRAIVDQALLALHQLSHRGAVDAHGSTADGCGLLFSIPKDFMRKRALASGIQLPEVFAVGMLFIAPGEESGA